jgi:predicted outer membrane repeat protein
MRSCLRPDRGMVGRTVIGIARRERLVSKEGNVSHLLPITALAVLLIAAAALATTITVGPSGDYPDIQPALTAASEGDTVLVAPGTYAGGDNTILNFAGVNIVLRSVGGPGAAIIDCEGTSYGFWFHHHEGPTSVIEGFTVTNGDEYSGGAAYMSEASPAFIDCTFTTNRSEYGGAVYIFTASPTFTNCTFSDNESYGDGWGGAVYCEAGQPTFTDCTFSDNSSVHYGGAIHCYDADPTLIGCTFERDSATNHGGALYCTEGSNPTVSGCTFTDLSAGIGMGVYSTAGSAPAFTDCGFLDSTGPNVIYCEFGSPTFTDCVFADNSGQYAGGLYLHESAAELTGCVFHGNTATGVHRGGGALYCDSAAPVLTNCTFSDNGAEVAGGTIHCLEGSPWFANCIVAFGISGPAVDCDEGTVNAPLFACCDVYGNAGGDWVGCIAGQGDAGHNMSADPIFCDRPGGDFTIDATSPCAAAHVPICGLIGALDVECDSPVENTSWGAIKALYR